jgi:putative restriction endonuclease
MIQGMATRSMSKEEVLDRLSLLRQHQRQGQRSPHKPLLVLLALGRLATKGTTAISWSMDSATLADLIRDYGPPSSTSPAQSAAYPFTRLRTDGIWTLNQDVPMDRVGPLTAHQVIGRLTPPLEDALRNPDIAAAAARRLVESEFPPTIAPDVLMAVGLDPDSILSTGVLGLTHDLKITPSSRFTSRTPTGQSVYDLHHRLLRPRPGTTLPAVSHVDWHTREVFKGPVLAA